MKKVSKGALADTRIGMLDAADTLRTREDYANAISRLWDRAAESYVQIGRHLNQARERLVHGEFETMIERDLPFTASVGRRLRRAAELVDSGALPRDALPEAWTIVAEIASLSPAEQQQALESGVIHPEMRRADVAAFKREVREAPPVPQTPPQIIPDPIPPDERALSHRRDQLDKGLTALFAGAAPEATPQSEPQKDSGWGVFCAVELPDLLLMHLDGALHKRGFAGADTITLRLPGSPDRLVLHLRGDAYEIASHATNNCTYVGGSMLKAKVADFIRTWLRSPPIIEGTAVASTAAPVDRPEGVELPPPLVGVRTQPEPLDLSEAMRRPWAVGVQDPEEILFDPGDGFLRVLMVMVPTGPDAEALAAHVVQLHNDALGE